MKNTRAELTKSQVVEPVSIVPAKCGATAVVSVVSAAATGSVAGCVSVATATAGSVVDPSWEYVVLQAVRVTVAAVRSDAIANRPSGLNTLLIVNFLFLTCVEVVKEVMDQVAGSEKWAPTTGSTKN